MGELKPIGSEKLKGDEQIKRILDLTYYQPNKVLKESSTVVKESKSGVYGIEKEKDGYYVKKGLNENSLDYIGGMFMKNKNKFPSHNEALKKMEFLVEQENFQEATKYVLKQDKPVAPVAPAPEPAVAAPVEPLPVEPTAAEPIAEPIAGEEVEDPNDYMKVLKKMAGKLQEKFNKYEDRLESADYAEVIKQVLSAVDLDKLEESDIESIMSVFEDDEVEGTTDFPTDVNGEVPAPSDTEAAVEEIDGVASLDELINTPLEDDELDDTGFNDDFLDDPEIAKAERAANLDMGASDEEQFKVGPDFFEDEVVVDEELPISNTSEEDVRELDLDELTSMVNDGVKHSLGKYFE